MPGTSRDRPRVVRCQRGGVAKSLTHWTKRIRAGGDRHDVRAGASNAILDRRLGAVADGDHHDHGGHTDDHPERSERRAHSVAAERVHSNGQSDDG